MSKTVKMSGSVYDVLDQLMQHPTRTLRVNIPKDQLSSFKRGMSRAKRRVSETRQIKYEVVQEGVVEIKFTNSIMMEVPVA